MAPKGVDWVEKFELTSLDRAGFNVIPPSGTYRDLIKELDFIVYELGCRYIQILPIFPVPTTFGRMGRFGSPYAVLDFFTVDPALAEFDPQKTPIEQFMELTSEIHKRDALLILDIPINHTGWGSRIHDVHPQWLRRTKRGEIEVPEVWGVRWEDLTKLDYSKKELWEYMAKVFLTWCERGVDGFRGDAGYMIPLEVWEYIIAKVRESFPDTIFFLEGLGGDVNITRALLNSTYDWAYSELFQNYTKQQIIPYVQFAKSISEQEGLMIHFCETHDNNRLASVSKIYAKMRTGLCAMLSFCGGFGFACGVEWFATQKINVHEITSLNWGNPENQIRYIRRLNFILKVHPAFFPEARIHFPETKGDKSVVAIRENKKYSKWLIVIANLDCDNQNIVYFKPLSKINNRLWDLITSKEIILQEQGDFFFYRLDPGEVLCLSPMNDDLMLIENAYIKREVLPKRCIYQRAKEKFYKALQFFHGVSHIEIDEAKEIDIFLEDPFSYFKTKSSPENMVIKWNFPEDVNRMVMVPPHHILMFFSKYPFRIQLKDGEEVIYSDVSIKSKKNNYFTIFCPDLVNKLKQHIEINLTIWVYKDNEVINKKSSLLFLSYFENTKIKTQFSRHEILRKSFTFLASNIRGSLTYVPVWWGSLETKYNSLLSGNLNLEYLDDRWVMFTRLRAWVVHQGYSQEINEDLIQRFSFDYENNAKWDFYVPTGLGKHIHLSIFLHLSKEDNQIIIKFLRHPSLEENEETNEVKLILRPDIENRSHHYLTKAYMGPEHEYPNSISKIQHGFLFQPEEDHRLTVKVSKGEFVFEPEWNYMVHLKLEEERGLDPFNDLFSPGYFEINLNPGEEVFLYGSINIEDYSFDYPMFNKKQYTYLQGLKSAMDKFIVKNKRYKSVIAGFPWFLDWGRDSFIFCRSLIQDKRKEDAIDILKFFASYEENGTLPNLIKGDTPLNRDTSDAPLWFGVVCRDLIKHWGFDILEERVNNRSFKEILFSIARNYIKGTPNGIKVDENTGLVFSPAHFTWMDTNHPACTPREGYPIEIQALWYAFLCVLEQIDPDGSLCPFKDSWGNLKRKVREFVLKLFYLEVEGYFSDCLHCGPGESAIYAEPDDHLRPNQLLAVTMGLIEDREIIKNMLDSLMCLLVPGGIRSLADRKVKFPLASIPQHAIKDPYYPYKGKYIGDEDTMRKVAYHNGTVWTWLFPSYLEAYYLCYGPDSIDTSLSLLGSSSVLLNSGCVGHIPEIMDGDIPHVQRGCFAQAWGVSEAYRVFKLILEKK